MSETIDTKKLFILFLFSLGYLCTCFYRVVNAVIAPNMSHAMHFSAVEIGLLTSAYFLGFGLFQIPLGYLLDKYGYKNVQFYLFALAGIGSILLSYSNTVFILVVARFLIGVGVSGGLMSAFKATTMNFPKEKLPVVNSIILGIGGLGFIISTAPTEFIVKHSSWRIPYFGLGCLILLLAIAIKLVKDKSLIKENSTMFSFSESKIILSNRQFWNISQLAAITLGSFMAVQGLWVGQWLKVVNKLNSQQFSFVLLISSIAVVIGLFSIGPASQYLKRYTTINSKYFLIIGNSLFILLQCIILIADSHFIYLSFLWFAFGLFGQTSVIGYSYIAQIFPRNLAGRASTLFNFIIFLFAFLLQLLIGIAISLLNHKLGLSLIHAYKISLSLIILIEAISLMFYCLR